MADKSGQHEAVVRVLLDRYGRTYAEESGVGLADRPAALYRLLVVATLLSARISSDIAVAAARELFEAGYGTPEGMAGSGWQDRVDALGRGHYRRYDERTATMLGDGAALLNERWHGDLRELRDEGRGDADAIRGLLTAFPGIGPVGADIFLREVQGVWPQVAPYLDRKVLDGARRLGLPHRPETLAALAARACSDKCLARFTAALVRVALDKEAAEHVKEEAAAQTAR